jgi:hypothetical protein
MPHTTPSVLERTHAMVLTNGAPTHAPSLQANAVHARCRLPDSSHTSAKLPHSPNSPQVVSLHVTPSRSRPQASASMRSVATQLPATQVNT